MAREMSTQREDHIVTYEITSGITFSGVLTLLFIALKLTGVIDWSWVWVLSPLWIGTLLTLAFMAVVVLLAWIFVWRKDT